MLNAADSVSPSTVESADSHTGGSPFLLYAVIALACLNAAFLIGLALLTSNPIVLNPDQLHRSSLIVSGSLASADDRGVTVKIEQSWKGNADTDTVSVKGLSAADFEGSDVWILPLSRVPPADYIVTPRMNASAAAKPLLYPADPDRVNKLKSFLSPDVPSL